MMTTTNRSQSRVLLTEMLKVGKGLSGVLSTAGWSKHYKTTEGHCEALSCPSGKGCCHCFIATQMARTVSFYNQGKWRVTGRGGAHRLPIMESLFLAVVMETAHTLPVTLQDSWNASCTTDRRWQESTSWWYKQPEVQCGYVKRAVWSEPFSWRMLWVSDSLYFQKKKGGSRSPIT